MKVTKVTAMSLGAAAAGPTNTPDSVKISNPAKDDKRTLPSTQRGPKVLQSHQARQRCLEFSRG